MVSIQIIGKNPSRQFGRLLTRFLAQTPYRIHTAETPVHTVKPYDTLYLFMDPSGETILPPAPAASVAVVSAENTDILKLLQASGIRTIPCGLSDHNTFTLASSTEESTVISLQRSILSLSGELIEPMEFPVHSSYTRHFSRYQLMAFCAVGCVTGNTAKLTHFLREKLV